MGQNVESGPRGKIPPMQNGRPPRSRCKLCLREVPHRSILSKRGKCQECAHAVQRQAILEIRAHNGPYFKHWRQQMARSVGGVLLDDVTAGD
jgi:hypothetical protein